MSSSTTSSAIFTSSLRLFITKSFPISQNPITIKSNFQFRPIISFQRIPTNPPQSLSSSSMELQPIEELPPNLQEIIKLFQSVQDPKAKYEQLMFYGKKLKPLETRFKTTENKVQGCVSQVWVRAYLDDLEKKNVFYEADSDSGLTKGLAALLVNGLSGSPAEEVLRVSPDFAVLLGLQQSLTPSRNNGFLNMLKLMQRKALELLVEAEKGGAKGLESSKSGDNSAQSLILESSKEVGGNESSKIGEDGDQSSFLGSSNDTGGTEVSDLGSAGENFAGGSNLDSEINGDDGNSGENGGNGSSSAGLGSRGMRIHEILQRELSPVELEVDDVSYQHAGHAGVRGSDGETHFNLKVVSKEFEGKSLVKRHRVIYNLLQEELETGLHALSIVAKTPAEVQAR